ncbi:MAG: flagellar M-ring protein FliF, partial [Planctomycetales bacterium]|nr:flagellar M-ring protein FliF [Planctomycetales bacterium]
PKTQWNKARLLLGDLADPHAADIGLPADSIFDDPSLNHVKLLRQQELKLSRTIMQIGGVQNATVHISKPEPSPFVRDVQPTTASVVLQLGRSTIFSREQAASVVAMLSNSVEGLKPEHVTVMDTTGRLLSAAGFQADGDMAAQLEYRQMLEANLATKAEMMLAEALGRGRAVVRVSADVDFRRSERRETSFDPESKVKTSEKIKSTQINGVGQAPIGAAGTPSNIGASAVGNQAKPYSEKTEENETQYETTRIEDIIKEPSGTVQRLTVAAMVDLSVPEGDTATTPLTKEQVESIIKQAVGFDEERSDKIDVVVTKLVGASPLDPNAVDPVSTWDYVNQVLRNVSLGVASLVALLIGMMVLRKFRSIPFPTQPQTALTAEQAKRISELSARVLEHPDSMAKVLSAWLGEGESNNAAGADSAPIQPRRVQRAA